jgi:nicotinamidase-related amidase
VLTVDGTKPYPWPYDGDLSRVALVLAGWDESWRDRCIDPKPAMARCETLAVVAHHTIAVAHRGAARLDANVVVTASGVDGFHGGALDDVLRSLGCTNLLVAGLGLEGPVHSTLRSANDRGYECLLVTDACAPLTDDCAASAIHSVTMSGGIFGAVGTSAPVLAALTRGGS